MAAKLTEREQQVLDLLVQGLENPEIGKRLYIGANTVKTHVRKLFSKLHADNRVQLAVQAVRQGLVSMADENTPQVRELNDQLRASLRAIPEGRVVMTLAVSNLSSDDLYSVLEAIALFNSFTPDNDPYGEHDFGSVTVGQLGQFFWKIDYYDLEYEYGSEDPSDPTKTKRVLTIMRPDEF